MHRGNVTGLVLQRNFQNSGLKLKIKSILIPFKQVW